MTEQTRFLRQQTLSGANKCKRTPLPPTWSTADLPCSLPERKAEGLKKILEEMPLYIGEQEWIVGTRTFFRPNPGNEDGHSTIEYSLNAGIPYLTAEEIEQFGSDQSYLNKTHYTPDMQILLEQGVGGILAHVQERMKDPDLRPIQRDFLSSVQIAYTGLHILITRYADYAAELAAQVEGEEQKRLTGISTVCRKISDKPAETFREAVQLLWFGHLTTIIENFEFINYGRLDVILGRYLGNTPHDEALQLLCCLLMKMYDQVDVQTTYLNKYAAQLVVTMGGVLPNGENAVNAVSMLFLEAIDQVRLPEPEFNLRISSKNPPEFLKKAAELTVSGCNFVSYYNDDLFVENLIQAGLPAEYARNYGFDLCQDMNIPGNADFYCLGSPGLAHILMKLLAKRTDFASFEDLLQTFKQSVIEEVRNSSQWFNTTQSHMFQYRDEEYDAYFAGIREKGLPADWHGRSPMCPLPYLSALYHGPVEEALDLVYESYPVKEKGIFLGTVVEAINGLAAIRQVVYDTHQYTLKEVAQACQDNFQKEGQEIMRCILWKAPKWGNDDDYVDEIAVEIINDVLRSASQCRTVSGGRILTGVHQPHPVATGNGLMATPEGRLAYTPVAVTLTPESGTMQNGPTAALRSAAKLDHTLIQWNFCVMVNYFASVFQGNDGLDVFETLLNGYFAAGGMQHQPNVLDVEELKRAQLEPEKYKDIIVRLWGVSAHFVDLPKELQDEMIARFS